MIRFLLICIFLILILILLIPVLMIEWLIGKVSPIKKDVSSLRLVQAAFWFFLKIAGVKVTVIGEEKIPTDTAVLYVGNHRSYFDILLTYVRCKRRTGFIAKKEMKRYPLLSNWMTNLHCLFLDRENIKEGLKTILEAIEKMKSGISIFIFPEGTRNKADSDLELMPFHAGSFKIATKSKCPIVPVAMNNTCQIFEAHLPKVKPTHVVIEYCDPIYPEKLEKEDLKHIETYTQNIILETIKKNQVLLHK